MIENQNSPNANMSVSDLIAFLFFLLIATLRYPLFFSPFSRGAFFIDVYFSNLEMLAAFSIFMLLLKYRMIVHSITSFKLFYISLSTICLIAAIQFFLLDNSGFNHFLLSVSCIAIPFAVFLYAPVFKKLIIPYLSFLWLFNMLHPCWQLKAGACIGIPGNQNWHGAFLIATTPFLLFGLFRLLKKRNISDKFIFPILSVPLFFSLYVLIQSESRGANIALIIALLVWAGVTLFNSSDSKWRKLGYFYCIGLLALCCVMLIVIPLFFGDKLAELINYDVRIPLWHGAIDMFLDNFWLGVGSAGYEGHYAYYIPIDKFLRSHYFASRSPHPHNQLLFYAGSLGVWGLAAISYLWFYPIAVFVKYYKKLSTLEKIVFFSFLMLSIHAMLDLIMSKWPTVQITFILQGIIWNRAFYYSKHAKQKEDLNREYLLPCYFHYMINISAWCMAICALSIGFDNLTGSYRSLNSKIYADRDNFPMSSYYLDKAIKINNTPGDIYYAGMSSLLWYKDYRLTYKYFKKLEKHPSKIVVHSNARIGECLIKMGREKEALAYFDKEITVYPLSVIAHYNKLLLEKNLGQTAAAKKTANKLIRLIKFKGLKFSDLQKTINNPEFDGRFYLLKGND